MNDDECLCVCGRYAYRWSFDIICTLLYEDKPVLLGLTLCHAIYFILSYLIPIYRTSKQHQTTESCRWFVPAGNGGSMEHLERLQQHGQKKGKSSIPILDYYDLIWMCDRHGTPMPSWTKLHLDTNAVELPSSTGHSQCGSQSLAAIAPLLNQLLNQLLNILRATSQVW